MSYVTKIVIYDKNVIYDIFRHFACFAGVFLCVLCLQQPKERNMDWFAGVLTQIENSGWKEVQKWDGVSFRKAVEIVMEIRKDSPNAEFIYKPFPTQL